jgi:hypothetical protein
MYCRYKGWIYNPMEALKTETERKRNEIRCYKDGKDVYGFYIATQEITFDVNTNIERCIFPPIPQSGITSGDIFDGMKSDEAPPF